MNWQHLDITLQGLKNHYQRGDFTPRELLVHLLEKSLAFEHKNIWISKLALAQIQPYLDKLADSAPQDLPLYGVPFAIKDNIDLAGIATTAACAGFSYLPEQSAVVVQQLIHAGAIPMGKTNMDQFATGLAGTRSPQPWGSCHNAFDDDFISGGSSSGSSVAVSLGLVSFALGTDTAGSGRVPAAMNNLIGLKPSRGLLSTTGVVPACRSLDVVSIFALSAADAAVVFDNAVSFDPADPYARPNPYANSHRSGGIGAGGLRLGIPAVEQLEFFGDDQCEQVYQANIEQWRSLGADIVEIDFQPFAEAGRLLYQGPWLAERTLATASILRSKPQAMHPVVRQVIEPGAAATALEAFESQHLLAALKRRADTQLAKVDMLLTPTLGRHYRIAELLDDPIALNSELGYYTNFMNLLDYAAIAVPGGFTARGLPMGFTLVADKFHDQQLLAWANCWQARYFSTLGNTGLRGQTAELPTYRSADTIKLVVCGAHLDGLALNWQLRERGACLLEKTSTAPCYRLFALADGKRPGMVRDAESGEPIEVEVWRVPSCELGSFLDAIPAPLGIGKVELQDGRWRSGFICDAYGLQGATDISAYGGWRAYLRSRAEGH